MTLVPKTIQVTPSVQTLHRKHFIPSSVQAMLASPFHHAQQTPSSYHQREFLPKIPSPLSPRSANIHGNGGARPMFMSDDLNKPQSPSPVPYAKRAIKRAPVVSQDALKERRRGMFLKKVREGREDKRFEKHGEDIMRLDFVQRQKQWEAEQARSAPLLPSDAPEEEDEEDFSSMIYSGNATQTSMSFSQWQATPEEADEIAQMEDEELEALLSFLPGEGDGLPQQHNYQTIQDQAQAQVQDQQGNEPMSDHFGSDDDDYDSLFSDFINAEAHGMGEENNRPQADALSGDAMDMS